jgi:hypothetical protein
MGQPEELAELVAWLALAQFWQGGRATARTIGVSSACGVEFRCPLVAQTAIGGSTPSCVSIKTATDTDD